jgi:hypothetical protein
VEGSEHWIGHESGPGDVRYHLDHPFANGRFMVGLGPDHFYRLRSFDAALHRFFFGGFMFLVAPWDLAYCDNWAWTTDEIVLYDDPDHTGWYLAYNTRLGTYVHAQFDGTTENPSCKELCLKKRDCWNANYDVADCISWCTDNANGSPEYARKADTCKDCILPLSCPDYNAAICQTSCPSLP